MLPVLVDWGESDRARGGRCGTIASPPDAHRGGFGDASPGVLGPTLHFIWSVPAGVNRRVAHAKQRDPAISKTAADVIVPFERFRDMMAECRRLFESRGLDLAVWGHISDGNVHPNVIPRSAEDVRAGREAILELGARVIEMGGSPLAEHGVGRNPTKQDLLRLLHGSSGIEGMRAIKSSLDPQLTLANGVMFPAQ